MTVSAIILSIYLVIALGVFIATYECNEYEFAIFMAVFYPVVAVVWIVFFVLMLFAGMIYGSADFIRRLKARNRNDN